MVYSWGTLMDRPMTKTKMLISQWNSLNTITSKLEANMKDWKVLLKAKANVSIENKNAFKLSNFKVTRKCEMITNV
jgi:hypothetical protein